MNDPRRTEEWFLTKSNELRAKYPKAKIKVGINGHGEKVIGRYSVIQQRYGPNLAHRRTILRLEATY